MAHKFHLALSLSLSIVLAGCSTNLGPSPEGQQDSSGSFSPSSVPSSSAGTSSDGTTSPTGNSGSGNIAGTTASPGTAAAPIVVTIASAQPIGAVAAGGSTVIVNGTGFQPNSTVAVGATPCASSTYVSATQMSCVVPATTAGTISEVNISVQTPGAATVTTNGGFFYLGAPSLWLRADAGVTQTGGLVSAWADQSGTNNGATQATAAAQPTFVGSSAAFNNMPVISFAGAQSFNLANLTVLDAVSGATSVVVASSTSATVQQTMLSIKTGSNGIRLAHRIDSGCTEVGSAPGVLAIAGRDTESDSACEQASGGTINANVAFESMGIINYVGKDLTLTVNGTVVSTSTTFQDGLVTPNVTSLAATLGSDNGSSYVTGDVAEALLYSFAVTRSQRQTIEAYLALRYALP